VRRPRPQRRDCRIAGIDRVTVTKVARRGEEFALGFKTANEIMNDRLLEELKRRG
jgi:hypothetical protein